ncbi:hypothetical protein X975_03065, partial [Stegodyphus mimosarum]
MGLSLQRLVRYRADGTAFLQQKVAGDETWCHHFQPEGKSISIQWKHPDIPRPKKFKTQHSAGKMMLTAFFDIQIPYYWDLR